MLKTFKVVFNSSCIFYLKSEINLTLITFWKSKIIINQDIKCLKVYFFCRRLTILPSEEKVVSMFDRMSKFHEEFMQKYRNDKDNQH